MKLSSSSQSSISFVQNIFHYIWSFIEWNMFKFIILVFVYIVNILLLPSFFEFLLQFLFLNSYFYSYLVSYFFRIDLKDCNSKSLNLSFLPFLELCFILDIYIFILLFAYVTDQVLIILLLQWIFGKMMIFLVIIHNKFGWSFSNN